MSDATPRRRETDNDLEHVELDKVGGFGAKRIKDQFLIMLFGILLATVTAIPLTIWQGGRWIGRVETAIEAVNDNLTASVIEMREHVTKDDARTAAITNTINEFDKTMTRIVVNQESLQARMDRAERIEDNRAANQ